MRNVFIIALALVFSTGVAFAQNNASTDQSGDNNTANTQQTGSSNQADLIQRNFGAAGSTGHTAEVEQNGNSNTATLLSQGGVGSNDLNVLQRGSSNEVTVAQFWGSNTADIDQIGESNVAEVAHRGTFDSDAEIGQRGDQNTASIRDDGQGTGPNSGTSSTISQNGNGNDADVFQVGNHNTATILQTGDNQDASQYVVGEGNTVTQIQRVADNSQRIEISGDDNVFSATQRGGTGNQLYVNARGGGAGAPPTGISSGKSFDSDFTGLQVGSDNVISGAMGGVQNSLTITQRGDGNLVTNGAGTFDAEGFLQKGDMNMATITQRGDMNSADLSQVGNGNTATITQND